MKIDILSVLHFDNYFYGKYTNDDVIKFYSQIIDLNNTGDVLIIAGDLVIKEMEHQPFSTGKSKINDHKELLFICELNK